MRRLLVAAALLVVLLPATAALGQVDVDDIAATLRSDGFYAEAGADVDPNTVDALEQASIPIYLVVLATDPGEDPSLTAQRLGELFGSGTFVVRTPDFIGVYSVDYDDATVEAALDDSLDGWRESNAAGIKALDRELTGTGGFPFGPVILGGIVVLVAWGMYRGRKTSKAAAAARLAERRQALGEQADDVANDILALSDRVQVADNAEATGHYREANATFSETQDAMAGASNEMEFVRLSNELTEAEWHLEAVEAILEGRVVPEKPTDRPVECFFHQHKAGTVRADVETAAGTRTVSVCRECAVQLRRGEAPTPRQVVVGGSRTPAGRAPRSYGGGGFDLDIFDVVLGAGRTSYDWSRPRPARGTRPRGLGVGSRSSAGGRTRSSSRSSSRKTGGGRASRRL